MLPPHKIPSASSRERQWGLKYPNSLHPPPQRAARGCWEEGSIKIEQAPYNPSECHVSHHRLPGVPPFIHPANTNIAACQVPRWPHGGSKSHVTPQNLPSSSRGTGDHSVGGEGPCPALGAFQEGQTCAGPSTWRELVAKAQRCDRSEHTGCAWGVSGAWGSAPGDWWGRPVGRFLSRPSPGWALGLNKGQARRPGRGRGRRRAQRAGQRLREGAGSAKPLGSSSGQSLPGRSPGPGLFAQLITFPLFSRILKF